MFKEKERLAATVLTYLGRDECGRRESGSHGLADRNAFRTSGNHFGPEKHTIRHTWKLITDLSETETAQP